MLAPVLLKLSIRSIVKLLAFTLKILIGGATKSKVIVPLYVVSFTLVLTALILTPKYVPLMVQLL
jgi:hypothetical protein